MENENTPFYTPEERKEAAELLLSLCRIRTVSGFEGSDAAAAALERAAASCAPFDEILHTPSGNHIFLRKSGEKNARTVLLDAHFDEIGGMVQSISEEGLLRITPLGGLDKRSAAAGRFSLLTKEGEIPALCCPAAVGTPGSSGDRPGDWDNLPLFTGYSKEQLLAKGVKIGTPVGFAGEASVFSDGEICFRGLDNKAGATVLLYTAKLLREKPLSCNLALLFSAGEESFMTGVKSALPSLPFSPPDEAIVVDTDFALTPDVDRKKAVEPRKGPSVTLSVQTDRKMTLRLLAVGQAQAIPCQKVLWPDSTGTNANALPFLGGGIRTAVVSVPIKYMHTCAETLFPEDLLSSARLLAAYLLENYGERSVKEA